MMRRTAGLLAALLLTLLPAVSWAGGPPGDSPEPSFWILMALGALPIVYLIVRQARADRRKAVPVRTNTQDQHG